jgi:hypothetical protein
MVNKVTSYDSRPTDNSAVLPSLPENASSNFRTLCKSNLLVGGVFIASCQTVRSV